MRQAHSMVGTMRRFILDATVLNSSIRLGLMSSIINTPKATTVSGMETEI
jgi:hypothetical protein